MLNMTTTTNAENLQQYKIRFSLIVEQILAFPSSSCLVRKVKSLPPKFQTNCITMSYVIDNSYSDR